MSNNSNPYKTRLDGMVSKIDGNKVVIDTSLDTVVELEFSELNGNLAQGDEVEVKRTAIRHRKGFGTRMRNSFGGYSLQPTPSHDESITVDVYKAIKDGSIISYRSLGEAKAKIGDFYGN